MNINNNRGWKEAADPTCINRKGRPVARRHHEVSNRKELSQCQRIPYAPEEDDGSDIGEPTRFSFVVPKDKIKMLEDWAERENLQVTCQKDGIVTAEIFDKDMPIFIKFLQDNDIDVEDDPDDEKFADEIVSEVQEDRKEGAISRDRSIKARKVGEKDDAESLIDWIKSPNKSDLSGVDE